MQEYEISLTRILLLPLYGRIRVSENAYYCIFYEERQENSNVFRGHMRGKLTWTRLVLDCVKSVEIRRFFWSAFSYIHFEYRKIRTRKSSIFRHFSSIVRLLWLKIFFSVTLQEERSSLPEVFLKKCLPKNFTNLQKKHLSWYSP